MKKTFYPFILLVSMLLIISCKKEHNGISKQIVIDTTLASGVDYYLDLQPYGDRDDTAAITKQAQQYTVSEINNVLGTFAPVYHYSAFAKTAQTDQVILSVKEGNRGNVNAHRGDSTVITINFTIK